MMGLEQNSIVLPFWKFRIFFIHFFSAALHAEAALEQDYTALHHCSPIYYTAGRVPEDWGTF